MKKHHFVFLAFLLTGTFLYGQIHLNGTYTDIVFVDSTNVRDSPSINGIIIGKARHNSVISECPSSEPVEGKVAGVEDYWKPVVFEGQNGYIWRPNLADGYFKSELDADVHFLINFTANRGLEYKVFRNDRLISTRFFEYKDFEEVRGSVSFGTTFNSNGKEIIAVALDTIYKLFEWDGSSITLSNIRLQDDALITGKYFAYDAALINADKVNVRNAPKSGAAITETLDKLTKVELVKEKVVFDTINENPGCWYAIKRNGKKAYVWSDFIDIPQRYVKSNKVEGESFLYTNNAIYVFDESQVKFRLPIDFVYYHDSDEYDEMYKNDFIQFGNRGLSSNYQFLGICYSANSCGEAGGDDLYLWDGAKLIHFANDFSVGDGGYSDENNYIFPNEFDGVKNKVVFRTSSEYYGIDVSNCLESTFCTFSSSYSEMEFNGDTLVETETSESRLRAFLADSLPGFQLNHASFSDLNKDGIADAVFLMEEKLNDSIFDVLPKALIGVAYVNSTGTFGALVTNADLALQNYFSVSFKTENDTLFVRVNYNFDDYSEETKNPAYSQFSFVHDPSYNKLVWYEKLEAEVVDPESREVEWTITHRERFKKNKVSFKNAWESNKSR